MAGKKLRIKVVLEGREQEVWLFNTSKDPAGITWGPFHGPLASEGRADVHKAARAVLAEVGVNEYAFVATVLTREGFSHSAKEDRRYVAVHCRTRETPSTGQGKVKDVCQVRTLEELKVMMSEASPTTYQLTRDAINAAKLLRGDRYAHASAASTGMAK